ncbi:acyl-CoA thioester hydrolase/BAAT C-terminal domain-containing protein [Streptomyces sp. NPDC002559]
MDIVERELTDPWEGVLFAPAGGGDVGVLVLAGSSGRVERERARLLARQGFTALAIRWFGGFGQPPGICEVPLETFTAAVDLLRLGGARRVGILGTSKGAEAALLTAVRDPRVDVVVALSPTSRVWCNVGPGHDGAHHPYRSSWTWRGQPLPFVPMDDSWTSPEPDGGPVAIRGWYELSERTFARSLPDAEIPVESAAADLVLVAGGDDAMWPSLPCAERLARRRRSAGATVRLIAHAGAGHRPRLPGEGPAAASPRFEHGGTPGADALLGRTAWPHILDALGGTGPSTGSSRESG